MKITIKETSQQKDLEMIDKYDGSSYEEEFISLEGGFTNTFTYCAKTKSYIVSASDFSFWTDAMSQFSDFAVLIDGKSLSSNSNSDSAA